MKDWIRKLIGLGPLDGYKTIIGTFLLMLPQYVPGFPVLNLSNGITAAQILLIFASLKKVLEKLKN